MVYLFSLQGTCGAKYKFVKTRHGRYEKIAVDDEYTLGKSGTFIM